MDNLETNLEENIIGEVSAVPQDTVTFKPKTPLGKRLWELRAKIIASGEPLLDWEGVAREVAERRGTEYGEDGETNLH